MSPYKPQSLDTSEEAERLQFDIWRSMSSVEKFRLIGELCESMKHLKRMGLRDEYPEASDHEIEMRLRSTWLDRETMMKVYGWDPREHGASS